MWCVCSSRKKKRKDLGPVSAHRVGNTTDIRLSRLSGPVLPHVTSSEKTEKRCGPPAQINNPTGRSVNSQASSHTQTACKALILLGFLTAQHHQRPDHPAKTPRGGSTGSTKFRGGPLPHSQIFFKNFSVTHITFVRCISPV